ncbi:hypothetical protein DOE78_01735 [Bacillus sp. Y1]|nr:hypothetical protein [Bacillus sp. Y1]AYA74276.1 hypothetical protein DOE78_01735 [Bacillus sp. Y1]
MERKKFSLITNIYQAIVVVMFVIYAYNVQENWRIDVSEEKYTLMAFVILFLLGGALSAVELKASTGKDKTVSKKAIYWGIAFTLVFFAWRLALGLF